jgi:hypothetical protein
MKHVFEPVRTVTLRGTQPRVLQVNTVCLHYTYSSLHNLHVLSTNVTYKLLRASVSQCYASLQRCHVGMEEKGLMSLHCYITLAALTLSVINYNTAVEE